MEKIVLITGATSGIGQACARRFAQNGYNVIITARRADRLEAIKHDLERYGAKVMTLVFDVRDAAAATTAVTSLTDEWKQIDILVNQHLKISCKIYSKVNSQSKFHSGI